MNFLQDMTNEELQIAHTTAQEHANTTANANPKSHNHFFALTSIISIEREIRERRLETFFKIRHANVWD